MRLRLSVTSEERVALGHRARHEFDANGGVIGRNAACAWSLPDPTNTVSARHATISHNGRGFLITDTSTNGVYLNTVDAPIGRGAAAVLGHGDTLYLGHFVISVEVVDEPEDARRRVGAAATATPMIGGADIALPSIGVPSRPAGPPPLRPPTIYPSAPPMGSPPPNGAGGLSDLLSPDPGAARPSSRPLASPPIAPAMIPVDFAPPRPAPPPSIERAEPPPAPPTRIEALSERPGIPANAFPDLPGAPAPPAQVAPLCASNLAPPARPSALPVVAKAPLIPDIFDFSDLMGPKTASPAPAPAPTASASVKSPAAAPIAPPAALSAAAKPPPTLPVDFSDLAPAASASIAPPAAPSAKPPAPLPMDFSDLLPPASAPPPAAPPTERTPLRAAASLAPDAAPVLLDPVAVLRQRADDYSNAARQSPSEPPPLPAGAPPAPLTPVEPPALRLSPAAARTAIPLAQPPGGALATSLRNAAVAALCEGLGLDLAEIPPHVLAQTLLEFGRALRVAVDGMMPVLAARRSLKGELHMDQTRLQPRENNPLKFLSSGEEVLRAALKPDASGFLSLSEAMREGFKDIRAHEVAAIVALQGAVRAVLDRFDPAALEGSAAAAGKMFGRGPDKTKLWDQFVARYAAIADDPDRTMREIVSSEFARAYAQQTQAETQGRP